MINEVMNMRDEVLRELNRLEKQHNVKILYAVESGSRAWGFESKDSDWDVRFIYVHPLDWYLKIDIQKDNIEEMLENKLDLAGWELRKTLKLFRKSNPPLFEWLRSPIVYKEQSSLVPNLRILSENYFSQRSCMYHYLQSANNNFTRYLQKEQINLKKYFYVLRPILACEWLLKEGTMPPMEFWSLVEKVVGDETLLMEINKLLEKKIDGDELKRERRNEVLSNYLEDRLKYFTGIVKGFGTVFTPDIEKLEELFRVTLSEVWGKHAKIRENQE